MVEIVSGIITVNFEIVISILIESNVIKIYKSRFLTLKKMIENYRITFTQM